jgi:hypothetical protein
VPVGITDILERAQLAALLQLLLASCERGQVFLPRFYDRSLWRVVRRYML